MIPAALRLLYPCPSEIAGAVPDPSAASTTAGAMSPSTRIAPAVTTEHARLTAGTADMWRELVHLCWETP